MKYPDLQLRVYPVEERERSVVGNSDEADQVYSERRYATIIYIILTETHCPSDSSELQIT